MYFILPTVPWSRHLSYSYFQHKAQRWWCNWWLQDFDTAGLTPELAVWATTLWSSHSTTLQHTTVKSAELTRDLFCSLAFLRPRAVRWGYVPSNGQRAEVLGITSRLKYRRAACHSPATEKALCSRWSGHKNVGPLGLGLEWPGATETHSNTYTLCV